MKPGSAMTNRGRDDGLAPRSHFVRGIGQPTIANDSVEFRLMTNVKVVDSTANQRLFAMRLSDFLA